MQKCHFLYLFLLSFLLFGCSGTKNIPEGDLLYIGHKLKTEGQKIKNSERKKIDKAINGLIRPKPNRSILGMRPGIFFL